MEFIAHRAGNDIEKLRAAESVADVIEVDVHLGERGRVEVRHAKKLLFTRRLWERWYVLPKDVEVPGLIEIVSAGNSETHFWLDLKGFTPRLSRRVRAAIGERRPLTVSTKPWWLLGPFAGDDGVRIIRSAGNKFELALLLWLPSRLQADGSVVHYRLLSDTVFDRLSKKGLVFCWAATEAAHVDRLFTLGATGVILDDLSLVR
jgi:glycerophosphoryl diester phosphodiesterase